MATVTTTRAASRSGTAPPSVGSAGRYPPRGAGTARPRTGGRTQQGSRSVSRTGGRTQQGSQRSRPPARAAAPAARPAAVPASRGRRAPNLGRTAQQVTSPKFRNYQGIILAEFVLAELLAAATPVVTRQQDAGSGQYMSPYAGQDMVKLLSIGLLYFLLELAAAGGGTAGRLGAWFGGLILLVVGLNEGTNIARVLGIFSGLAATASGGAPAAAEGSAGNALQIFNQGSTSG